MLVNIIMSQNRKPIFSHLTLITVQNVLHRSERKFCTPQRKVVAFLIIQSYTLTRLANSVTGNVLLLPVIFGGRPHPSCEQTKCVRHGDLIGQAYGPITSTRYDGVEFARGDSSLKEFHRS